MLTSLCDFLHAASHSQLVSSAGVTSETLFRYHWKYRVFFQPNHYVLAMKVPILVFSFLSLSRCSLCDKYLTYTVFHNDFLLPLSSGWYSSYREILFPFWRLVTEYCMWCRSYHTSLCAQSAPSLSPVLARATSWCTVQIPYWGSSSSSSSQ